MEEGKRDEDETGMTWECSSALNIFLKLYFLITNTISCELISLWRWDHSMRDNLTFVFKNTLLFSDSRKKITKDHINLNLTEDLGVVCMDSWLFSYSEV